MKKRRMNKKLKANNDLDISYQCISYKNYGIFISNVNSYDDYNIVTNYTAHEDTFETNYNLKIIL